MLHEKIDYKQIQIEEFQEMQKEEIQEFLDCIHEDINQKNKVYFAVMQIRNNQIVNRYFTDTIMATNWIMNSNPDQIDTYFTTNELNCPKRKNDNVFSFRGFYFDIDMHDITSINMIEQNVNQFIDYLAFFLKKELTLKPSKIVFTGRGLHLYYILNTGLPRKGLDWLYSMIADCLAETIKIVLNALKDDLNINFRLDKCHSDYSRLLRVPATYNTKADCFSEILFSSETRYTIEELREFTAIDEQIEEERQRRINNLKKSDKQKQNNIRFFRPELKLHNDRLQDLQKLVLLRNYDMTGYRELILFLIRYYNSFIDINSNKELIEQINSTFIEPLNKNELIATKSAEKAYRSWILEKTKGYNYQNRTLIKILEISEQEQENLKTIISKDEKKRRRVLKKQWSNKKRDGERKSKKEEVDSQIKSMLLEGKTYREIKEKLNVSNDKIRYIKQKQV